MIAPHPFGYDITVVDLANRFSVHRQWEDRYRQLILLAQQLPPLSSVLKQPQIELSGCENRVWLGYQRLDNGNLHFYGDSDGRIVRGLLTVLLTAIENKTPQYLRQQDPLILFNQLGLYQQLSTSRVNGLQRLSQRVLTIVSSDILN
ncbi:cysteine desulfurase sulfur acceptor subunit CsdE [Candidatus Regiella insecticola]|uniref:Cysteine desulfurase sulfur acceptor subunit CsdE n=1 Tax=Candidatus Regiella insecticola TaxID=138073 RepID=A0A6L2ZPR9_9ENTR|nr:cysteine desulfurase sulfur acceptor subunit CsdE [Candidatus Regiella insecticola]GFN46251.1 cysteine desulfurase sulfur acceptor subunit CsdE [Candidatus Regiella insecticola]